MNEQQVCVARRRRSRTEVEQLVAEYETSGLSRIEFCAKHELSLSTFSRHRKWRARQVPSPSNPLLAVELSAPSRAAVTVASGALAVVLRGGRRIEVSAGFDAGALERLVRVLEGA